MGDTTGKKTKLSLIELLADRPPRSPEFKFKGVGLCWVLLTREQTEWCKHASERHARATLEKEYKDHPRVHEIIDDLLKNDASTLESRNNYFDCFVLQACLRNPENGAKIVIAKDDPYVAVKEIARTFTPQEIDELMDLYLEWSDENDPHQLTEADIKGIVEEAKKQELVSLMQFGSNALRVSLIFSACVGKEPEPPMEPATKTKKAMTEYKRAVRKYQTAMDEWNERSAFVISQIARSSDITSSEKAVKNGSTPSGTN